MLRLFILVILFVGTPLALAVAQPTYTLDKDPLRAGKKALEEGRYADAGRFFQQALAAGYQVPKASFGLAEVATHEGRFREAEDLYRRAVEGAGKYPEAHAAWALLLLRQGRQEEAETHIATALAEDDDLWPAQYGQARLLLLQKRPEEAKKVLERGAKRKGVKKGEDLYHHGMSLYWLNQGKLAEAEKAALMAFALSPNQPEISLLVGEVYRQQNTPYLAIQAFESALSSPGAAPSASLLDQLGQLYEQVGKPNEARDAYLRAVAADSMYAPAFRDLASVLRRGGQPEAAARAYLRYTSLEPNDVDALVGLSNACFEAHRLDESLTAAEKALALDSTRADAKLAYVRSGLRSTDALVKQKAAGLAASLPDSLVRTTEDRALLIGADIEAGRYDEASVRLEGALAQEPENAALHFQQGMLRMKQNDAMGAVASLEKATSLAPHESLYSLNLGIAFLRAKDTRAAMTVLRKTVAGDPTLTSARILFAQTLVLSDSLAAAATEYRKVLAAEPANASALRGLGYCQIQRAAYAEAVSSYQKATEIDPKNADGWAGLGSAYLGRKEWTKAEQAFRRALSIDPNHAAGANGLKLLDKARGQ